MSQRYKGAVISATPPTTTGGNSGTAPGIWTLQQQMQAQNGGVWPPQPINYIEDVFSTYLYTGTNSTRTITNGIDLSGNGGMVWLKSRNEANAGTIYDTLRGPNTILFPQYTNGNYSLANSLTAFTSSGFTLGNMENTNYNTTVTAASWTFRKQPKFFDVVTYTGNGVTGRSISHNLKSVPGCIIVKKLDSATANWSWAVWHRSIASIYGANKIMELNTTNSVADIGGTGAFNSQLPTSTEFYVGNNIYTNLSGSNYVAYLFAHDAGGFGLTGSDNVISCGSFTTDGSGLASVNLGYEPQWVLFKASSTSSNWYILDNMRGLDAVYDQGNALAPNLSNAEFTFDPLSINATGFNVSTAPNPNTTYIYIAIRRGPMQTPTTGTSVYGAVARTGTAANATVASSFPVDLYVVQPRSNLAGTPATWINRLAGGTAYLRSNANFAESTLGTSAFGTVMNGVSLGGDTETNYSPSTFINWFMRRAPGFMDVVCYSGNDAATNNQSHNLSVVPEMLIIKDRNIGGNWAVLLPTADTYMSLNSTSGKLNGSPLPSAVTSTTFNVGSTTGYASVAGVNWSGYNYVAYLFASCPGVSKVGTYTGTGATQTINCGFAARFVMIKRTDAGGYGWLVWDTTRGMVAGTDPFLLWNATNSENNTSNTVYTDASGFQIVTTTALGINASGGTYIYLAIA